MRIQARLHDYNDARGFGFVTPEGGERAFVHIKAFASPGVARRPVNGDQLSFELQRDPQGRLIASGIRFAAGERSAHLEAPPSASRRSPVRASMAIGFLAAVCAAWLAGVLPAILPLAYMLMSLLSLAVYALDKSAARSGARRVPENTCICSICCVAGPAACWHKDCCTTNRASAHFRSRSGSACC